MENNDNLINRIKDLDESVRLLFDYYQDNDYIDVYIYSLIASAIKNYYLNKDKDVYSKKLENSFLSLLKVLLSKADEYDEIHIQTKDLKYFLNLIEKYILSDKLYYYLEILFAINEQKKNINYKMNLHTTKENDINKLEKEYKYLEEKQNIYKKNIYKYINDKFIINKGNYYHDIDNTEINKYMDDVIDINKSDGKHR